MIKKKQHTLWVRCCDIFFIKNVWIYTKQNNIYKQNHTQKTNYQTKNSIQQTRQIVWTFSTLSVYTVMDDAKILFYGIFNFLFGWFWEQFDCNLNTYDAKGIWHLFLLFWSTQTVPTCQVVWNDFVQTNTNELTRIVTTNLTKKLSLKNENKYKFLRPSAVTLTN